MINIKELIDEYVALGYPKDTAVVMARQEFNKRSRTQKQNDAYQAKQQRSRLGGFGLAD